MVTIGEMNPDDLKRLADRLTRGEVTRDEFVRTLLGTASAELGETTLDLDRRRRCGYPEVVFGQAWGRTATGRRGDEYAVRVGDIGRREPPRH